MEEEKEGKDEEVGEDEEVREEKEDIFHVAHLVGAVVVAISGFYLSPYKQAPTDLDFCV